jgi:hypothetical protein
VASIKSFRIRRAAATIAFVTLGCLASTATIAQAAPEPGPVRATQLKADAPATAEGPVTVLDTSCAPGDLCFWVHADKGGAKGRVSGNNTAWGWPQASCANGTWNNCASSIQNNGNNCDVNVYDFAGYSGASLRITRGTYISDLSGYWITFPFDSWNDDIQSNRWC